MRKRILLICGTTNQTTQMHQVAEHLPEYDHYFTPYYGDGILDLAARFGLAEFTVLGRKITRKCVGYLERHDLKIDHHGRGQDYELVVTSSDLVVP
jgi:hypothetical protein